MEKLKRICLFAAYSENEKVEDYVLDYLKELSQYADIYYLADNTLKDAELDKLAPYVKKAWAKKHNKYDFGSYSELAKNYVGWDEIEKYDELIIANDSCFCLNSFKPVFEKMDENDCDAWALTASDHGNRISKYNFESYCKLPQITRRFFCINSYFILFRKKIINDSTFREFLNSVKRENDRYNVYVEYEIGLTNFLLQNYKVSLFVNNIYPRAYIYGENAFRILKQGMPLLKVKIFSLNILKLNGFKEWADFIFKVTGNKNIYKYFKLFPEKTSVIKKNIVIYFSGANDSINKFVDNTKPLCDKFKFDLMVADLPLALDAISLKPDNAIIHLPEAFIETFLKNLTPEQILWLKTIPYLQINIINQNNDLMPQPQVIEKITQNEPIITHLTDNITMTVAQEQYCTQEMADKYNMPISLLDLSSPEFCNDLEKFYNREYSFYPTSSDYNY